MSPRSGSFTLWKGLDTFFTLLTSKSRGTDKFVSRYSGASKPVVLNSSSSIGELNTCQSISCFAAWSRPLNLSWLIRVTLKLSSKYWSSGVIDCCFAVPAFCTILLMSYFINNFIIMSEFCYGRYWMKLKGQFRVKRFWLTTRFSIDFNFYHFAAAGFWTLPCLFLSASSFSCAIIWFAASVTS